MFNVCFYVFVFLCVLYISSTYLFGVDESFEGGANLVT